MSASGTVYIVDDDEAVRSALQILLASCGLKSRAFSGAQELLLSLRADWQGCLLLDVRMPGMSGLDLHERLIARGVDLPVILLTGHGDVPMAVRAMKRGAFDFVQKPFNDQQLLDRIQQALALDERNHERRQQQAVLQERHKRLSVREREVAEHIVLGQTNKVIAAELGISERTVELHRARAMEKMETPSVAQLVEAMLQVSRASREPAE
jgi:two-component system response regulator DctR